MTAPIVAMTQAEDGEDQAKHPHAPPGTPAGGQFTKKSAPASKSPAKKPAAKKPAAKPAPKPAAKPAAPAAKAPGPPGNNQLNLKVGGNNDPAEVSNLQHLLADLKVAGVKVDGKYGPETEAAVKAAQSKLGMKPTGRASSSLIRRMADAHALSPCIGKVAASAYVEVTEDGDPERVMASSASGVDLILWSDSTIWLGDQVELDLDDADKVVAGVRLLGQSRQPGEYEVTDWLSLNVDGDGATTLLADDEDDEQIAVRLADLNGFANELAAMFEPTPVAAAAGADTTLGHDKLHHYWVAGPGLAKWQGSPTPWTTLVANLVEATKDDPKPLETLKKWASRWFIEVFHYAAGSDKNRVAHGHPPRGSNVGPG